MYAPNDFLATYMYSYGKYVINQYFLLKSCPKILITIHQKKYIAYSIYIQAYRVGNLKKSGITLDPNKRLVELTNILVKF